MCRCALLVAHVRARGALAALHRRGPLFSTSTTEAERQETPKDHLAEKKPRKIVPKDFWSDVANQKAFLDGMAQRLNIEEVRFPFPSPLLSLTLITC